MRTVHEVSMLTGVSIRTLQYYDKIGLLPPAGYTESGYRLYDDTALENLISLARGIKAIGVNTMDFTAFDTKKIDEYAAQAKASWGTTPAYREFEEKSKGRTMEEEKKLNVQMMEIFKEFGDMRDKAPDSL